MQHLIKYFNEWRSSLDRGFSYTAIVFVRLYRHFLSPYMGGNCRFYPTCSHYAEEAYGKLSFFNATKYVFRRILSCRPFSKKEGYDPIPEVTKHV